MPALSQVLVRTKGNGEVTYYIYGLGLIGEARAGNYFSYHFDLRGSTAALSDGSGQVVERFQYSSYGSLMYGDSSKTPFLFNGMYGVMSDANGLYYMRARFYSPEIRRFVNRDVLLGGVAEGQTLNRFAFVKGQVISRIDPLGTIDWGTIGAGGRITNKASKSIIAVKWEPPFNIWIVGPEETTSFFTDVDFIIYLYEHGYIDIFKIKGISHTIIHDYPYFWTEEGSIVSIPPVRISHEVPEKIFKQWYLILRYILKRHPTILDELYALNYEHCRPIPIISQEFQDKLTNPIQKYIPPEWFVQPSLPEKYMYNTE